MRYIVGGLALGCILLGGWIWVRERSIREQEAKVAELEVALDSALAIVRDDSVQLAIKDSAHKVIRDSLETVIEEARAIGDEAAQEADSLARALRASLSPEFRPVLDRLVEAHARERTSFLAQIRVMQEIQDSTDALLADHIRAEDNLRSALRQSETLREYWKEKAKRDPWEKPWFTATTAVGAAALSFVVFK